MTKYDDWSSIPTFTSQKQLQTYYRHLQTPEGFAAVYMKNDIEICYENRQYIATTKLIYSGIDICANLLLFGWSRS